MGKLFLSTIVAALFAISVGVSVPSSSLEVQRSAVDEAKKSAFTKIGEKYYMIEAEKLESWFGAAHLCRSMDAQLATIESEEEWSALNSYLISKGYDTTQWFWLSGNILDTKKGFYSLSTGQPMKYSKWSVGQPDFTGTTNENCVHLWRQGNEFQMNDWTCTQNAHYICESAGPTTISFTIW